MSRLSERYHSWLQAHICHSVLCFQSGQPRGSQNWMDTLVRSLLRTRGLSVLWLLLLLSSTALASYSIGVGRADITGPTAEIVFVSILHCMLWNRKFREITYYILDNNEGNNFWKSIILESKITKNVSFQTLS